MYYLLISQQMPHPKCILMVKILFYDGCSSKQIEILFYAVNDAEIMHFAPLQQYKYALQLI